MKETPEQIIAEATEIINSEVASDNEKGIAYFEIGLEKAEKELYEEAIKDFDKCIKTLPDFSEVYFFRGNTKANIELYKEAIKDYDEFIKRKPNYEPAFLMRGIAKEDFGSPKEEVLEDYKQSLKILCSKKAKSRNNDDTIYYRFRPISEYIIEELVLKNFFVANPASFNDPFDCPILEDTTKYLLDFFKDFRVASMCHGWENILLWSHYAKNHTGICIGYKFKNSFFEKNQYAFLEKIKYPNKIKYESEQIIEDGLLQKYEDWEYENEYRLIHHLNEEEKAQDYKLIPLSDGIEIAEIIFGCKCPDTKRKMIYKLFSEEERKTIDFSSVDTEPANRFELNKKDYPEKKQ